MQVLAMPPPSTSSSTHEPGARPDRAPHAKRKRTPEVHDGERERLSKRLSLLKLEQHRQDHKPGTPPGASASFSHTPAQPADESMQIDDARHRIYIHNIDDELSSDSEPEDGRLVFHPDFRKHLRPGSINTIHPSTIPRRILANDDGELAGMQLVLYREPKALSVPEEQDNVRRAVREARQRLRERQKTERQGIALPAAAAAAAAAADVDADADVEVHDDDDDDDDDNADADDDDDDAMELD